LRHGRQFDSLVIRRQQIKGPEVEPAGGPRVPGRRTDESIVGEALEERRRGDLARHPAIHLEHQRLEVRG
jgi:hypothetical protein